MTITPEMVRIARGTVWSVAGILAIQALGFATALATARALPPDAFGIAGMALVVTALLGAVRDLGLAPAVASGRVADERTQAAAHWFLCGASVVLWGVVALAAPAVAAFFGNDLVIPVLRVQAASLVFGSAVAVPQAILQRQGRFAILAALGVGMQALTTAGVVVAILVGAGVWTLVVPGVVAAAVMVPAYWVAMGGPPPLVARAPALAQLLGEGLRLSASSLFSYVIRNADKAILGRLAGERALGLYAFSYGFLVQPLALFSHAFVPVLLPALGKLGDRAARSDGVVRVTLCLVRIGSPFMLGGALTAPLFVPLLFGPQWGDAVVIVQVMMFIAGLQIPGPVFGTLCLAIGDARLILRWSAWCAGAAVPVFLLGALAAGPLGVALAYLAYTVVQVSAMYAIARRRFELPLHGLLRGLARVARDLLIMTAAVLLVRLLGARGAFPSWAQLVACVSAGALTYVAAVRLLARDEAALLLGLLPRPVARAGAQVLRITLP